MGGLNVVGVRLSRRFKNRDRAPDLRDYDASFRPMRPIDDAVIVIAAMTAIGMFGLFFAGCVGEGNDVATGWIHTPIRDANGHLVHRVGTRYYPAE